MWDISDLAIIMRSCIILHNMIVEDEQNTYVQHWLIMINLRQVVLVHYINFRLRYYLYLKITCVLDLNYMIQMYITNCKQIKSNIYGQKLEYTMIEKSLNFRVWFKSFLVWIESTVLLNYVFIWCFVRLYRMCLKFRNVVCCIIFILVLKKIVTIKNSQKLCHFNYLS